MVLGGIATLALLAVVGTGWILFGNRAPGPRSAESPSLAVLPFDNLSPDGENAYLAAGIHAEILTHLARVEGIRLISPGSVLRYEGSERSPAEVAGELGVSTVMLGSVQRSGDRLRLVVNLIDAASEELVWAERYDRDISDIFAIQTDVALRIAEQLRGVLTPAERAALAEVPTDNVGAYAHYLRGHEHFRRMWSEQDVLAAAEAYGRAVDLDPGFAPAWARVVQTRIWLGWQYRSRYGRREQWAVFGASVTITEAPVGVESGVPSRPVTLSWATFSEAADEAGLSRRLGGIHFLDGDLEARRMGRLVGALVWEKALSYIERS